MNALDRLLPTPRLLEIDHVDLALPPPEVWARIRHRDFADSPWIRALFAIRLFVSRMHGEVLTKFSLTLDQLRSTAAAPGFRILVEDPPFEIAVGAIGRVWEPDIPFVHVNGADDYAAFDRPGYAKVAWAIRCVARGDRDTRFEIEVRVDATDDESWRKFKRYFAVIGIGSRFIRRLALAALEREMGAPEERSLPGDEFLADARGQETQTIDIHAGPEAIWPWLVQMGCRRGGFYSYDALDNGGAPSAREIHPEWTALKVGDVVAATPEGEDGFEVLRIDEARALVLGGLYDSARGKQLPFGAARPDRFWQVTWSFVLERLDRDTTRLHARARVALDAREALHLTFIRSVHHFMQAAQLRHLKARAEDRLPGDSFRDVLEGLGGAAIAAAALLTRFSSEKRAHWGLPASEADRSWPGDQWVRRPKVQWTHAIAIDAPAEEVWPWVAQIGSDRGGFYSYQWLENLFGCEVKSAERIHPEWALAVHDQLRLHPKIPPLDVVELDAGRCFIAYGAKDESAAERGAPWAEVSWAFIVEPLDGARSRLISRYRADYSDDLKSRIAFGPLVMEPIGFAMDRRMLIGTKARVERARRSAIRDLASAR